MSKVFVTQLKDMLSAEQQIAAKLPEMIGKVKNRELKRSLESHRKETDRECDRLEKILSSLGEKADGKKCEAMEAILKEGDQMMASLPTGDEHDPTLAAWLLKIEHYEIASYSALVVLAKCLQKEEMVDVFKQSLQEEINAASDLFDFASDELMQNKRQTERFMVVVETFDMTPSQRYRGPSLRRPSLQEYGRQSSQEGYGRGGYSGGYDQQSARSYDEGRSEGTRRGSSGQQDDYRRGGDQDSYSRGYYEDDNDGSREAGYRRSRFSEDDDQGYSYRQGSGGGSSQGYGSGSGDGYGEQRGRRAGGSYGSSGNRESYEGGYGGSGEGRYERSGQGRPASSNWGRSSRESNGYEDDRGRGFNDEDEGDYRSRSRRCRIG
ncbi:MAG: DUF892 family protein [Fimbriimonadaceae bacterium]|nr:DUF892 family protein [Fimbriimonadaceae bacterium]QYK55087.1 MAG: DUF892 family protein [Fimbriimonadaceae bacterium]